MNYKKVMLIGQFFIYALINPTLILILISLWFLNTSFLYSIFGFSFKSETVIYYIRLMAENLSLVSIYICIMIPVFLSVILLNYLIFNLKKYDKKHEKSSFRDFLKIYFQSQEIYWQWFLFVILPILVLFGIFMLMITAIFGANIFAVIYECFISSPVLEFFDFICRRFSIIFLTLNITYLIFGCSLIIRSHLLYVKLARGEKVNNSY